MADRARAIRLCAEARERVGRSAGRLAEAATDRIEAFMRGARTASHRGKPAGIEPALRKRLAFAIALIGLLALSCGVWATTTPIAGAVIASGIVVVDSNIKKVQHPSGGIVAVIPVKNGDRVKAGDVVLKLDDTQARANLGIVASQLVQLTGRKARLEAERDLADSIKFPPDFLASGEEAKAIAEGEKRLFKFRRTFKQGQTAQLTERIGQIKEEIKGLTAQREAKKTEVELMVEELDRLEVLRKKELMATNRILAAQRDLTRLKGEWGALVAQMARAQGQISEMRAADHRARPDHADGGDQGAARAGGAHGRAHRAQGRRRGPAQAHRARRAAGRHRARPRRPHRGRGDRRRRDRDDDRAGHGRAERRGAHRHLRHRPGARRPEGDPALPRLQPAHHARDQRHGHAGGRRPHARQPRPTPCSMSCAFAPTRASARS